MNQFWTRVIIEVSFIVGSILTLYCLYMLWARRSYEKARRSYEKTQKSK
ncbi:MAG: hypothetical protein ACJZ12_00370 [Candidatus Neomarinimicrobiota bacterium]